MGKGLFIVSTSSGIGKTTLCVGLMQLFSKYGLNLGYMKPIECGASNSSTSRDLLYVKKHTSFNVKDDSLSNVFLFRNNFVPLVSSQIESVDLKLNKILTAYKFLERKYNVVLVEGEGSTYLPIKPNYNTVDLITSLKMSCLVIGDVSKDSINDIVLSIEYLHRNGVNVIGFCFSDKDGVCKKNDTSHIYYHKLISNITKASYLGIIPYISHVENDDDDKKFIESIRLAINIKIDYNRLLKHVLTG